MKLYFIHCSLTLNYTILMLNYPIVTIHLEGKDTVFIPWRGLPVEIDVWVVSVLRLPGVALGEGAEEGVGKKTGHLLLRYRLGEEKMGGQNKE